MFHCKYIIYIQLLESEFAFLFPIFLSFFYYFSIKLPKTSLKQKVMPFAVSFLQHSVYFLILHTSKSL